MISFMSDLTGKVYQSVLKPVLFRFPADRVHEVMVKIGDLSMQAPLIREVTQTLYRFDDQKLMQNLAGMQLDTPIGLAAGFDYGAQLTHALQPLGFGFQTVGTITFGAYSGNTPPMLGRLPLSQSLWVNKGFKNDGAVNVRQKLSKKMFPHPVGMSVGATNKSYKNADEQIAEYIQAFKVLNKNKNHAYWELNISCPNLAAGTDFQTPALLKKLLRAVDELKLNRPLFIKMPVDITPTELKRLLDVILESSAKGIIIGNLTKKSTTSAFDTSERETFSKGGFSGAPVRAISEKLIRVAYQHTKGKLIIIGCGGIFSAQDAIKKFRAGASALQLITGLIYCGPQMVGQINRDIKTYMDKEGYQHISEMIGVE